MRCLGEETFAFDFSSFDFVRVNADSIDVTLSGERTAFPDFEGYIDGELVYSAESPDSGPTFWNLGPISRWVHIPSVGVGVEG